MRSSSPHSMFKHVFSDKDTLIGTASFKICRNHNMLTRVVCSKCSYKGDPTCDPEYVTINVDEESKYLFIDASEEKPKYVQIIYLPELSPKDLIIVMESIIEVH